MKSVDAVRGISATLACAAAMATAPDAFGYENQWHFGAGVGAATFAKMDSGSGPALGVHASYDVSDMFDARVELTASQHHFVEGETTRFYGVSAGMVYKIDVLEWVPYVGLTGGYYAFDGRIWPRSLQKHELGISVPLGLDYTSSRSFGMGVELRYHGFMSDPLSSLGDAPYFTALLRAEYRAGW